METADNEDQNSPSGTHGHDTGFAESELWVQSDAMESCDCLYLKRK